MSQAKQWVVIVLCAGSFIVCDWLAASWGKNKSQISLLLMIPIAPMGYVLFGILNKHKSLAVSSGIVNILMVVGTVLLGILFFDQQKLTTQQIVGLALAVVAVGLLATS